jgi:hypothetical protein
MRAIHRRIRRLEEKWAPEPVSRGPTPADIVRERRRRRLEAEGQPFEEPTPVQLTDGAGRPLSIVDILRQGLQRRREPLQSNPDEVASI